VTYFPRSKGTEGIGGDLGVIVGFLATVAYLEGLENCVSVEHHFLAALELGWREPCGVAAPPPAKRRDAASRERGNLLRRHPGRQITHRRSLPY
jgi:hypothetical protein